MLNNSRNGELFVTLNDFSHCTNKDQDDQGSKLSVVNLLFSSYNQMSAKKTTAQDDLISLCYLMFYLLEEENLPLLNIDVKIGSNQDGIKMLMAYKKKHPLQKLVKNLTNANLKLELSKFVKIVEQS